MAQRPLPESRGIGARATVEQSGAERLRLDPDEESDGLEARSDPFHGKDNVSAPSQRRTSDEELAARFFAGDERAARELIERFHQRLYGMLIRLTRNHAEAEELFQETFLRAFAAASRFDSSRPFKPWLFTIAVNLARDRNKRRSHPAAPEMREPGDLPERIGTPEDDWIRRADVAEALSRLPRTHRDVLVLRYFQGLTETEIAHELGIPGGTVKSRTHHALRKLRDALHGDAS